MVAGTEEEEMKKDTEGRGEGTTAASADANLWDGITGTVASSYIPVTKTNGTVEVRAEED